MNLDVSDIDKMATNDPLDPYAKNPFYSSTPIQRDLIATGVNPMVYFSTMRALVFDYGFNTMNALLILKDLLAMAPERRNKYFAKLVFTVGRRIGFVQNRMRPLDDMYRVDYTDPVVSFGSVDRTPMYSKMASRAFGPLRFKTSEAEKTPNPPRQDYILTGILFPRYSKAYEANILIHEGDNMANFVIRPNAPKGSRIKMIVSDRIHTGTVDRIDAKSYGGGVQKDERSLKRVRRRLDQVFSNVPVDNYGRTGDGMYYVPEWTILLLARREARIKWLVEKVVRNWRVGKISRKRESIWNSGYMPYEYNENIKAWVTLNPYDTTILPNWIRERAVNLYDLKVLAPVHNEVLHALSTIVHSNYPITQDELGFYLLEWLDITWEEYKDEKKLLYASNIRNLLTRYSFDTAYSFFYNWAVVNGIIPELPNGVELSWVTLRNHIEPLIQDAQTSGFTDIVKRFVECISFVFEFEFDNSGGVGKIPVVYTDKDFTGSIEGLLDAKSDLLELHEIEDFDSKKNRVGLMEMLLRVIALDIVASRVKPKDLAPMTQYYTDAGTYVYPTEYDRLYPMLAEALVFGTLKNQQVGALTNIKDTVIYENVAKDIKKLNLNLSGTPITLDIVLSAMGLMTEDEGLSRIMFVLNLCMMPIVERAKLDLSDVNERIQRFQKRADLFFSPDHVNRVRSIEMSGVEDEEIMDAMMRLDGMSLDSESDKKSKMLANCKDRRVVIKGNQELSVEIEPTVEFCMLRGDQYKYDTYFYQVKKGVEYNSNEDVQPLPITVKSKNPTMRLSVPIPYGKSGYIECKVTSLSENGDIISIGEMPIVRVVREKTSVRSGITITDYDQLYRPNIEIILKDTNAYTEELGTNNARSVVWTFNSNVELVEKTIESFEQYSYTLCDMRNLFKFCLLIHAKNKWDDSSSEWYYRKLWFNGDFMDKKGIESALNMSTSPFKDIVLNRRSDIKAQQEISIAISKKLLSVYKALFLFDEYNSTLNAMESDSDLYDIYRTTNTLDYRTFMSPAVEEIYNSGRLPSESVDGAFSQLPYLVILNFISAVIHLYKGGREERLFPCYPESYRKKVDIVMKFRYALECVEEIQARMTILFANLSLRKAESEVENTAASYIDFDCEKFFAKTFHSLAEDIHTIPKTLGVFDDLRVMRMGSDFEKNIGYFNVPFDSHAVGFLIAFTTLKKYTDDFRAMYVQATTDLYGTRLGDKKYRGFESDESRMPYFIEIVDENGLPLPSMPLSRIDTYRMVERGFKYLALGDYLVGREDELKALELDIRNIFAHFVSTLDVVRHAGDMDAFSLVVRKCKEFNNILM